MMKIEKSEVRSQKSVFKRYKEIFVFLLATGYWLLATGAAYAAPKKVSSEALIENSKLYDGKVILYEGEAIGEVMLRGDYGWVNVSDGTNAIGVWAKKEDLSKITYCGSYKFRGDKILIEGVFNRSCSLHPGELDIHAKKIKVLKKGEEIYHPLNLQKIRLSLLTALLALFLFALTHFLKRK